MKPFFATSTFRSNKLATIFCLFSFYLLSQQGVHAQTLKEIPNPENLTLSSYIGGTNEDQFFDYVDINSHSHVYHYSNSSGQLKAIPFSDGILFTAYQMKLNNEFYFYTFDQLSDYNIQIYDGAEVRTLPYPDNTSLYEMLSALDEKLYTIGINPLLGFQLFAYDGVSNVQKAWPAGHTFLSFIAPFNGRMLFSLLSQNQVQKFFSFNGNSFTEIQGLPDLQLGYVAFYSEDYIFMSYEEPNVGSGLVHFDGTTFTKIQNPLGYNFNWQIVAKGETEDAWYISYGDVQGESSLFVFDGEELTKMTNPTGYNFPYFVNRNGETAYFSMVKSSDNTVSLFKSDGESFQQIGHPAGTQFSLYLDNFLNRNYYNYMNPSFQHLLMGLTEGDQSVIPLGIPTGYSYHSYALKTSSNIFFSYYNNSNITSLFTFDGIALTQIPNPSGKYFNATLASNDEALYVRYDDLNSSSGTLYKLHFNKLPASENNTVVTNINTPYSFDTSDFIFEDEDNDDELVSIVISETVSVGALSLEGSTVTEGDVILEADISLLMFVPNTDETGIGYDFFKYKVFDGSDLSEADYTMTIDVLNTTGMKDRELTNAKINLYPNPVQMALQLDVIGTDPIGTMNLTITAMNGQLMEQRYLANLGNDLKETFDVSQFPSGNFILIGKTEKGEMIKQSFVVNR